MPSIPLTRASQFRARLSRAKILAGSAVIRTRLITLTLLAAVLVATLPTGVADAQRAQTDTPEKSRGRSVPVKPAAPASTDTQPKAAAPADKAADTTESVQADVSTRNVAVTSNFTGTEIVVFGAVDNSRQKSAQAGVYDVVIVIEGGPSRIAARRKSRVGGIWLNTKSAMFDDVPSYYAISSTRPLDEIAPEATLIGYEIGFDHIRMNPVSRDGRPVANADRLPPAEMLDFRNAVIRLKKNDGLYVEEKYSVAFIGRSLFRASIALPANVAVGPFETRVYLFRQQQLLSQYNVQINLEREGIERIMHNFAFKQPFAYGVLTVILALVAGLVASTIFRKGSH